MPYIIYVPGCPRPYITNDPRIYIDAKLRFMWLSESRPYADPECSMMRRKEDASFQGDRRAAQVEQHWLEELARRTEPTENTPTKTVGSPVTHGSNDLAQGTYLGLEDSGSLYN